MLIYKPDHPNTTKSGYILEHRYVMAEKLGRPLLPTEDVHHIDGDKTNNDPSNLEVLGRSEHSRLHNRRKQIIRGRRGRIIGVKKI